jgi:predicted nucleic acid-binding protein
VEVSGFLDTNVLLRYVLQDDPIQAPAAAELFRAIEAGATAVRLTNTVVFESVYTLQRFYEVPRAEIAVALLAVLDLPGVVLPGKAAYSDVCALWTTQRGLSFADCFHAVCAERFTGGVIISFDRGYDRLPGVHRIEPTPAPN